MGQRPGTFPCAALGPGAACSVARRARARGRRRTATTRVWGAGRRSDPGGCLASRPRLHADSSGVVAAVSSWTVVCSAAATLRDASAVDPALACASACSNAADLRGAGATPASPTNASASAAAATGAADAVRQVGVPQLPPRRVIPRDQCLDGCSGPIAAVACVGGAASAVLEVAPWLPPRCVSAAPRAWASAGASAALLTYAGVVTAPRWVHAALSSPRPLWAPRLPPRVRGPRSPSCLDTDIAAADLAGASSAAAALS
jgi:hypothetical protein